MAQPVIELNNVSKRYRMRRGWHVKSILRKLRVSSRAEAIACLEELRAS